MRQSMVLFLAALAAASSTPARGAGIDRDMMLSEAPATPDKGTVRVTGSGIGQSQTDIGGTNQSSVSGSIMWAPFQNFAADVGAFYQGKDGGPSARLRYQFLNQASLGLDMSAGVRFKTVGFHPDRGEVEFALLAGRTFGPIELVVNGVFGVETGGANGKDIEVKSFVGWRFSEQLKAGVDGRFQTEIEDEGASATPKVGRDFDVAAGPALSWMVTRQINLQALVGVFAPKRTNVTSPGGVIQASFDF
jgi:hypothetical protein